MNGVGEDRPAKAYESLTNGLWVSWGYNLHKYTGFVVDSGANWANVQAVRYDGFSMPELEKVYCVPKELLWIYDKASLAPDDLEDLLAVAQKTSDTNWIKEITQELGKWKPASDLNNYGEK